MSRVGIFAGRADGVQHLRALRGEDSVFAVTGGAFGSFALPGLGHFLAAASEGVENLTLRHAPANGNA